MEGPTPRRSGLPQVNTAKAALSDLLLDRDGITLLVVAQHHGPLHGALALLHAAVTDVGHAATHNTAAHKAGENEELVSGEASLQAQNVLAVFFWAVLVC
eukprot:366519-Chlamydomonas_euryale.AAC.23